MSGDDEGFASRWSRRKALAQRGETPPPDPPPSLPPPAPPLAGASEPAAPPVPAPATPPPPTLAEAEALTPASDFTRFVARDVDPDVRNTALRKLFADPHFNRMDGLDTYIDDYGKPDPLPASMLRQLVQSRFLGLFSDSAGPAIEKADEDPDLQLQPDDGARCAGAEPGAEPDAGRQP
jgi:hypothetical protein